MTTTVDPAPEVPVRKSITVKASAERAFQVFTEGYDTWWPRSHHIGKAPMKKAIIEGRVGGRCYSEQTDGIECDWGKILVWEPPRRFVMAWQINHTWGYEPDVAKSSEVEIRFTPEPGGSNARRPGASLLRASRRRRRCHADRGKFSGRMERPASDVRQTGGTDELVRNTENPGPAEKLAASAGSGFSGQMLSNTQMELGQPGPKRIFTTKGV